MHKTFHITPGRQNFDAIQISKKTKGITQKRKCVYDTF